MLEHFQASTYKTDPFVVFLREYFKENICLLCAEIHRLYIHGYVGRLVRNAATYENDEIVVCVIICHTAQHAGKQYTKRILPPFVTPECNISLENAVEMYRSMPDGRIKYDSVSELLGTVCAKTVRRHYLMILSFTKITVSLLAEYLALTAPFVSHPGQLPYEDLFMLFMTMMQAVCDAEVKRSGTHHNLPPPTLYLHPVYVSKKARSPLTGKKPLNLSSGIHFYFDTS
jgi:hypothetical protein